MADSNDQFQQLKPRVDSDDANHPLAYSEPPALTLVAAQALFRQRRRMTKYNYPGGLANFLSGVAIG